MEYYLAFDKGSFIKEEDRYCLVSKETLGFKYRCNDLKALCNFTMSFASQKDLKKFILERNPRLVYYKYFDLVIVSKKRNSFGKFKGTVPYQEDSLYFNFDSLVKVIYMNAHTLFFYYFCKHFRSYDGVSKEIKKMNTAVIEFKDDYIIKDAIRDFLNKFLYPNKTFSYDRLYSISMFVANLLKMLEDKPEQQEVKYTSVSGPSLSPEAQFEQEWLEDRARIRKLSLW